MCFAELLCPCFLSRNEYMRVVCVSALLQSEVDLILTLWECVVLSNFSLEWTAIFSHPRAVVTHTLHFLMIRSKDLINIYIL